MGQGRGQASGAALAPLRQLLAAQYRDGRGRDALNTARQILKLAPKQPDVSALAGKIAMELGDAEAAVAFYEAAVAGKRDFVEAHHNLGLAQMRLGRVAAAIESYRRAAKHRPDLAPIKKIEEKK